MKTECLITRCSNGTIELKPEGRRRLRGLENGQRVRVTLEVIPEPEPEAPAEPEPEPAK